MGNGDRSSWGSLTPRLSIFLYRLGVTPACTKGLTRYARNDGNKGAGTLFLLGLQGATPLRVRTHLSKTKFCAIHAVRRYAHKRNKLGQLDPKFFYLSVTLRCCYCVNGLRVKGIIPLWVWATPTKSIAQVKQNEVLRYSRR